MAAETKEKVVTVVNMTDGTKVEFPGKRKLQKTSDFDKMQVRLDFINGETRTFQIQENLARQFACHGAEQKLGDEIAGVEDIDDAVLAVDELIERLSAGEWGVKREASGIAGTSVLVRALVELTGKDVKTVREFLKDKSQQEKMALRVSTKLKPIVERLEAEKASKAAKVDTDAIFSELEALPAAA